MKLLYRCLFLATFLFAGFSQPVQASHQVGSDMTWTCNPLNPCVYNFTYTFYRDCPGSSGMSAPSNVQFTCTSGAGSGPTTTAAWVSTGPAVDITPTCPGQPSDCSGGTFPGVFQQSFTRTYNFCASTGCSRFDIDWSICCRSNLITSGAANNTSSARSVIRPNANVCFGSPVFNSVPVVYICNNQTTTYSMAATDPDGDLLQYTLIPCGGTIGNPVNYNPGFSSANPIGPNWAVNLNPGNGDITFTPSGGGAIEVGVMCVQVNKIRSGRLLASVVRDIEIRVINCNNNIPGLLGPAVMNFCAGQQTCYNITSFDLDASDILSVSVVSNTSGATVNIGPGPNPTTQVCWTPTAADIGSYTLVLEVSDDACPILGIQQFTYQLNVIACDPCDTLNQSVSWTHTQSLLDIVVTNTSSGSGITFTEFCWGDGTPNQIFTGNYTTPVPHTFPAAGSYEVCVKILTFIGEVCCHDTLCKKIVVTDQPCDEHDADFTVLASTIGCTFLFTDISTPGSSTTYWDFGSGQVFTGSPILYTFPASGTYTVTMTSAYHPPSNPNLCCYDTETRVMNVTCLQKEIKSEDSKKPSSVFWNNEMSELQVQLYESFQTNPATAIQLYDLRGKLLQQREVMGAQQVRFDLSGMPGGVYMVRIMNDETVETKKFVKF